MTARHQELEQFRSWHDEAFLFINQAMTQEAPSINRLDVALVMYQRGLGTLDMALCVDTNGPGDGWAKARKMQQKMARTRCHVDERIRAITNQLAPPLSGNLSQASGPSLQPSAPERPPSYEEAIRAPSGQHRPPALIMTSGDVESELQEILDEIPEIPNRTSAQASQAVSIPNSESTGSLSESGEVLLTIPGVQIFFISASGEVTTPFYPDVLRVVKFAEKDSSIVDRAPAFIEVGDWTYPLLPSRSPVLRAQNGGYLFPDLEAGLDSGQAVGIILPDQVSQADRDALGNLLNKLTTNLKTEEEIEKEYAEYKEFSTALASGLVKGAELLGKGLVLGAVKGSQTVFHGTNLAKQYVTPEAAPKEIDPRVLQGLEAARVVSTGACKVSGWMVSKVGKATAMLGRMMAPHLEQGANRALTHFTGSSSTEASNQLKIVGDVASGTVAAISTLYMALENSSKILAKNIANNTVIMVAHKYGTDAAAVTDAALSTAGNSYLAFYNTAALGPKGIAKRVAKDTGKAFIGADQEAINARASVAPDQSIGVQDVLTSLQGSQQSGAQSQQQAVENAEPVEGSQQPAADGSSQLQHPVRESQQSQHPKRS